VLAGIALLIGVVVPVLLLRGPGGSEPDGPIVTGPFPTGPGSDRVVSLPPFIAGGEGWFTFTSDPARPGDGTVVWASTTPIVQEDIAVRAAIPPRTIRALPPEGIVVTVLTITPAFDPLLGPFPYDGVAFDLATAHVRAPVAEEPEADDPGSDIGVIDLYEEPALVRVYFGTRAPSDDLIEAAQRQLDTLQLPPTCPAPAVGPYGARLDVDHGSPGDAFTISGLVPFRREDGSYDTSREGSVVAWWNANPGDWPSLASSSTTTPTPAVEGSLLVRLGDDREDGCEFAVVGMVPDVAAGEYPIVVISEGGGSASIRSALTFHVD
jgi:hypothetical protein